MPGVSYVSCGTGWLGGVAGAVPDGAFPAGVDDADGVDAEDDDWACGAALFVDASLPPHAVSVDSPTSNAPVRAMLRVNECLLIS